MNQTSQQNGQKYPLLQAIEQKHKSQKDYEKQMARITLLKQSEQKNLQLVKLYELAAEKAQIGQNTKKQLLMLRSEADLLADEKMRIRKEQIAEIKRRQWEFIQNKKGQKREELKLKQSFVKEYKSRMKLSKIETKSSIISENHKIHDTLFNAEKERMEKLKEMKSTHKSLGLQNYEWKVQNEIKMAQDAQERARQLEKDEQKLLNRLKETQNLLQESQKKYQEVQSTPQSKRRMIKDSTSTY